MAARQLGQRGQVELAAVPVMAVVVDVRLFVGNPAAAGAGLTLHASHHAVYESFSNQAAHFLQSLDRIHRRGQTRKVTYQVVLSEGTLEVPEYHRLLTKADHQATLLGDASFPALARATLLADLTHRSP